MSSLGARIAVLPRATASEILTAAVSRAGWAVAIVVLILDLPLAMNVLISRGFIAQLLLPVGVVLCMIALLIATSIRPTTRSRIAMLVGGAFLAGLYEVSVLNTDPGLNFVGTYILNRPAFILVLVGPGIARPIIGLMWAAIGYVTATASLLVASLVAGVPVIPGWGPTIAFGVYGSTYVALAVIRATQARQLPDLARLEDETRKMALERQFEQRAAAVIHDTVLNDLSVVMNSTGTLDLRTRERFAIDVETLSNGSWLRESRGRVPFDAEDEALRNGLIVLVSEMQWRGLTVDVTGNPPNVLRLSSEQVSAIHAAVKACLENVLKHANTPSAEVALGTSEGRVSVMVVDHGAGFDPDAVAEDRLGLRGSVVGRIESLGGSVKIWSQVGSGTSVILSMPAEVVDDLTV